MKDAVKRHPGPARGNRSFLVAIDPGVDATGVALFHGYDLMGVRLLRDPYGIPFPFPAREIVVERPVQRGKQSRVRVEDLLTCTMVAGFVTGACTAFSISEWGERPKLWGVKPADWKGGRAKSTDNDRSLRILDERERGLLNIIKPEGLKHNVLDAIGIGLWALGRTPRNRTGRKP